MKILLAGPGTGKTTKIKDIIDEHGDGSKFLILSFTNATVNDLQESLEEKNVSGKNCMTLHKFAVKYNHDRSRHVLEKFEQETLEKIAKKIGTDLNRFCDFLSCTTFDQMIERFVNFAKTNPAYLKDKLGEYEILIIDEYQDFNPSEQSLIDILISIFSESYLLGDDDQCIYDFKDASSDKIISMHNDAKNQVIDHEHKCYRCPDKVVQHATNLILNNKKRVVKKWEKSGKAGDLRYQQMNTFSDVAGEIFKDLQGVVESEKVLILTPVEFAILPLIELLKQKQTPFTNFFLPKIPKELLIKAWEIRSQYGQNKYLNLVLLGYLNYLPRKKFYELIKKHFDKGKNFSELCELLKNKLPTVLKENSKDFESFVQQENYADIADLYNQAKGESADEKLENMLRPVEEIKEEKIKIMSIHKSKGLGADHVFILGLNEGILPNGKKGNDSIESQRRLLFVGMTRAKSKLRLFSNVYHEGRDINTVNKPDFSFHFRKKLYQGKASTFIAELKL